MSGRRDSRQKFLQKFLHLWNEIPQFLYNAKQFLSVRGHFYCRSEVIFFRVNEEFECSSIRKIRNLAAKYNVFRWFLRNNSIFTQNYRWFKNISCRNSSYFGNSTRKSQILTILGKITVFKRKKSLFKTVSRKKLRVLPIFDEICNIFTQKIVHLN